MSAKLIEASKQASQNFRVDLMAYKASYLNDLSDADTDILTGSNQGAIQTEAFSYSVRDTKQLQRFLDDEISFDQAYPALRRFVYAKQRTESKNKFIQSVKLNGKPLNQSWLYHKDLVKGGNLEYVLGEEPNYDWGTALESLPSSMSD